MKRVFTMMLSIVIALGSYAGDKVRGELITEINGFQWYNFKNKEAYTVDGRNLFRNLSTKNVSFSVADKDDIGMFVVIYREGGDEHIGAFNLSGEAISDDLYDKKDRPNSYQRISIVFSNPSHKEYYIRKDFWLSGRWGKESHWLLSTNPNNRKKVILDYDSYSIAGNCFISRDGKYSMLTKYDGEELVKEKEFTTITYKKEANLFTCKNDNGITIIDPTGTRIVKDVENVIYQDNIIEVINNGSGIIAFNGKWIVTPDKGYDSYKSTKINGDLYYLIKYKGKQNYHLISNEGVDVLSRGFDEIINVSKRYVKVKNVNSYGIMSLNGKEIIPTSRGYTYIGDYDSSKGTFAFTKKGVSGFCDAQGREISTTRIAPTADDIKANGGYASAVEMKNGSTKYYKVSKGGRYGLTDSEGKEVVPCEMEALESAGTGYLKYKINGFWGVMNYAGKILIDTDRGYTSIGNFVTFTKRFPYTMTGYKGECDINGKQISKIKVETPKQEVAKQETTTSEKKETIIIEHKHDPIPVNVWVQCNICGGSGRCQTCGGSGIFTGPAGNKTLCSFGCGGSGKCSFCAGSGGHYEVEYK